MISQPTPVITSSKCKILIGTSGWHYEHWKGIFYPPELPKSRWFDFYARYFPTVEINSSFYHLPSEKTFASWHRNSPADFCFAVKANRFITHVKKLRQAEEALDKFLQNVRALREKLGPILFQLPPSLRRNPELLEEFLPLLPKDLKIVFEFRNESWFAEEIYRILSRYNISLCLFDMPGFTTPLVITADFSYIRFHGSASLYSSCYTDEELSEWSRRISSLARDLSEIYIYFNNDVEGFALFNAQTLASFLQNSL